MRAQVLFQLSFVERIGLRGIRKFKFSLASAPTIKSLSGAQPIIAICGKVAASFALALAVIYLPAASAKAMGGPECKAIFAAGLSTKPAALVAIPFIEQVIEGERLRLRPMMLDDLLFFRDLLLLTELYGAKELSNAEIKRSFKILMSGNDPNARDPALLFAKIIEDKDTRQRYGFVNGSIVRVPGALPYAMIGWGLLPDYRGFGRTAEAVRALRKALVTDGAKEIRAAVSRENAEAKEFLVSLGFRSSDAAFNIPTKFHYYSWDPSLPQ
jgi:RimJ/RimL family protein N-acetyltransferase